MDSRASLAPQNASLPSASTSNADPSSLSGQSSTSSWDRMSQDARAEVLRKLKRESVRLRTFQRWSSPLVMPEDLARAGFFYFNDSDRVQCVFCLGIIHQWERGDVPMEQHREHFPRCPFVIGLPVGNLPIRESRNEPPVYTPVPQVPGGIDVVGSQSLQLRMRSAQPENYGPGEMKVTTLGGSTLNDLGVLSWSSPAMPAFRTLDSRIKSFSSWPRGLPQKPLTLAEAGLYYTGVSDEVKCFQCDGGLKGWEPHDDPWVEHAKWFPECNHVLLIKGKEFVLDVKKQTVLSTDPEARERAALRLMREEPALTVLGMGINFGDVKKAILNSLEKFGRGYTDATVLARAAHNFAADRNLDYPARSTRERDNSESGYESMHGSQSPEIIEGAVAAPFPTVRPRIGTSTVVATAAKEDVVMGEDVVPTSAKQSAEKSKTTDEKFDFMCKICMANKVEIVILPCGHLCSCQGCSSSIKNCPICREEFRGFARVYLS
ncbi:unnamed protein product [Notodromas monacha]|uniref:RING-type domain-containing protein n=1 Tax=Notodromas monacha TaxID=399045 RepID=A0A7R9BFC0_9CRUS|nr:unnamed protein product [Notodromas monacha]CAG0914368.1 unnamed protein product [Notodromas monacha]